MMEWEPTEDADSVVSHTEAGTYRIEHDNRPWVLTMPHGTEMRFETRAEAKRFAEGHSFVMTL